MSGAAESAPAPARTAAPSKGARRARTALWVALCAAFLGGAAASGYWSWREIRGLQRALAEREEPSGVVALGARLNALQAQVAALRERLEGLPRAAARDGDGWPLAEIRFLLQLADQRLALARDARGAVAALGRVQRRLRVLGPARFAPLIARIEADIEALRPAVAADRPSVAARLAALQRRVRDLPLRAPARARRAPREDKAAAAARGSGWRGFLDGVWRNVQRLVVVRRVDPAGRPLLGPDRGLHARRELRLALLNARLAWLERDASDFRHAIEAARALLVEAFDARAGAVREAAQSLGRLADQPLAGARLDTARHLGLLRRLAAAPGAAEAAR